MIHTHALATFLQAASGQNQAAPSPGPATHKLSERKSIEFLDIFDKSLDRKIWKHVQKELKRKRSFSEGEISKTQARLAAHGHGGHRLRQVAPPRPPAPAPSTGLTKVVGGDIRIQVSNIRRLFIDVSVLMC